MFSRSYSIVLASSSPYRRQLLLDVGIDCTCESSIVDEYGIRGGTPMETAILRARAKAEDVAQRLTNRERMTIVIGADQVCYLDQELMGKPKSDSEWLSRLQQLRGKTHHLSTAVCMLSCDQGIRDDQGIEEKNVEAQVKWQMEEFIETTAITFRQNISDEALHRYVSIGEARNCAGGYMMERKGAWLIERIDGDWQNVIGLPIFPLITRLQKKGVPCFGSG